MMECAYFQEQLNQQELMYELLDDAYFAMLMSVGKHVEDVSHITDLHYIVSADGRKFKVSIEEV